MKCLITGGAGFIGGHLAHRLLDERNVEIYLLDDFSRAVSDPFLEDLTSNQTVELLERDLLRPDALRDLDEDFTHIVHFAAIVGVAHVLKRPYEVLRKNEMMTFAALDLAHRQRNLERFVFASTSEIVAGTLQAFGIEIPTPETTPITVPDPSDARHTYLLSKLYGEALCHHSGLPFTIVRPHNVYGPRMGLVHVIPELAKKIHALPDTGGELEVFSCDHRRTFCYISDAVEQIERLMTRDAGRNGTFNLGTQAPEVTIRTVAETIIEAIGKPVRIKVGPTTPGSPTRRCPDMSRTIAATNCESQVSLKQGVRRTLAWYGEHVFTGQGPCAV